MRRSLALVAGIVSIAFSTSGFAQIEQPETDYFIGINRHIAAGGGLNIGFVQGTPGERTLGYIEGGLIEDYGFHGPFVGVGYDFEVYDKLFVGGVMSLGSNLFNSSQPGVQLRFGVGAEARYLLWETLQLRGGYTYGHGLTVGYAIQW